MHVLRGQLHHEMPKIFGLESLENIMRTQAVKDLNGDIVGEVRVESYWVAELHRFWHNGERATIAAVKTDQWRKGAILIPSTDNSAGKLGSPNPHYPVDLNGEHDIVLESLNAMSLFPESEHNLILDGRFSDFGIEFGTFYCSGGLSIRQMNSKTPSLIKLHDALLSVTKYMIEVYDNDEIREFMKMR
jgi:hypothetical protein